MADAAEKTRAYASPFPPLRYATPRCFALGILECRPLCLGIHQRPGVESQMKDYDGSSYPLQPVDSVTTAQHQPWPAAASSQPLGDARSQDGDSLLFGSKPPPSFDAEP